MKTKINLAAIEKIESGGNAKAFNFRSKATGLYQITPICLADWNKEHPELQYRLSDLWNPDVNRRIADWYLHDRIPGILRHYKIPETVENILIAYNWGIGNLKGYHEKRERGEGHRLPQETVAYLAKYRDLDYRLGRKPVQ